MQKIKLARNLRKNILRGHPWVYASALEPLDRFNSGEMVQILDSKGSPLAWAFLDKEHDFSLRILSLDKSPPNSSFFKLRVTRALSLRSIFDDETTAYRLINGEGDALPGLICDRYEDTLVLQFDSLPLEKFWMKQGLVTCLAEETGARCIVNKSRHLSKPEFIEGKLSSSVVVKENGIRFNVNILDGQKTGFFLDQRDNRAYLARFARGKRLLNLFSYTGGFSVYSGVGGASHVTSVDIAPKAIENAAYNWRLNDLNESSHQGHSLDCFEFLKNSKGDFDRIVVDPPSMAPNEKSKASAVRKYTDIFALAAKNLRNEGHLFLSSCSSHINFDDFSTIVDESLSQAKRRGRILRISGQGSDHPFRHVHPEMRYLKFYHLVLD